MALAPFFHKAALAASHILQGFDRAVFADALNTRVVGVSFDDAAACSREGVATLELALNLLARLYPRLSLAAQGDAARNLVPRLLESTQAINPNIEFEENLDEVDVCLSVGDKQALTSAPTIYVGSTGWVVRVSSRGPVGSGQTDNPFGAGAAACFGAANIFRILFASHLSNAPPDDLFSLSLLDYVPNSTNPTNPDLVPVDLGETHLVGLGAIGNGAIWALARTPYIHGHLHLVDDEAIDESNPQRYVLATATSEGIPKVSLAAEALGATQLSVFPHQERWGDYMKTRHEWILQRVAIAVDSAMDRCAIQASLPRWTVNAWTQTGDLGVSRHEFVGDQACVMCLYLPEHKRKNEDRLVAEAIGLPDAFREVRELLYTRRPVGKELITRIASAQGVPLEPLLPFADQPLQTFYSQAICGGIVLALGGDFERSARAEVPLAFQSVLAGIMLAAELIAHAGRLNPPPPTMTKIDLLQPLGDYLSLPAKKHLSGNCICQDPDYILAYKSKYSVASETS